MDEPIFTKFPNIETHNSQSHLMNIPQNLGPNDNYNCSVASPSKAKQSQPNFFMKAKPTKLLCVSATF
jgi:hypothetical protein